MKWLGKIQSVFGLADSPGNGRATDGADLQDFDSFRRELHRRRALIDRAGGTFVLLVFEIRDARNGSRAATLANLGTIVSGRARVSDVFGYYDEARTSIGVVLPETDHAGARRFIESVESLFGDQRADGMLHCSLSQYPDVSAHVLVQAESKVHQPVVADAGRAPARSGART